MRDFGNNKIYGKANKKMYKGFCRRGMDNNTRQILWTGLWLLFITGLCVLFNSAAPLWLLIFWMMGVV